MGPNMKTEDRKSIKAVVDRIEDKLAVLELEGKGEILWPVSFLPKGTKPGNILDITIVKNPTAEKIQREKIKKLQERLKSN